MHSLLCMVPSNAVSTATAVPPRASSSAGPDIPRHGMVCVLARPANPGGRARSCRVDEQFGYTHRCTRLSRHTRHRREGKPRKRQALGMDWAGWQPGRRRGQSTTVDQGVKGCAVGLGWLVGGLRHFCLPRDLAGAGIATSAVRSVPDNGVDGTASAADAQWTFFCA